MKHHFSSYVVLFGSQTGTSEEVAEAIVRKLLLCGVKDVTLTSFENVSTQSLSSLNPSTLLIAVVSTTGLGEIPKPMHSFWRQLKSKFLAPLPNLHFAAFGCGDNTYGSNFNRAIRLLATRMEQLQAVRVGEVGFGDVQAVEAHETALRPWTNQLLANCGLEVTSTTLPPKVLLLNGASELVSSDPHSACRVTNNQRMTPEDHVQDVHIVSIAGTFHFEPGDVAVIVPQNSDGSVLGTYAFLNELISDLPKLDDILEVRPNRPDCNIQAQHLSFNCILKTLLDLNRPPSPYLFEFLQQRLKTGVDSMYREKLSELITDYDLYLEYVWKPRRTTVEVLADFTTVLQFSINDLFDIFPPMKPRQFSVASSPEDERIDICLVRIAFKTSLPRERFGLCSQYLCNSIIGQPINISIFKGTMHLPDDITDKYFIFLAAGTGIAPIRSMIRHLHRRRAISKCWLLQGCRYIEKDALFRQELGGFVGEGMEYTLRGSRDQSQKVYLQHIIEEHAEGIWKWIHEFRAMIYLSGNNKLPAEIRKALAKVAEGNGESDGNAFVRQLERSKQFQHETW